LDINEAAERGWKIVTHEVSAEKDGHVFKGEPEDVLARVERFDEHGDRARAATEVAQRARQHEEINLLLKRLSAVGTEYLAIAQRSNAQQVKQQLEQMVLLWREVLEFPSDVLLENERFVALRDAIPSDLAGPALYALGRT
jgi:hypothetical protein